MPDSQVEVVFFDIDDTLVDDAAATRAGALGLFERYRDRLTGTDERLMQRWNALLDHHFERYLRGETSFIGQRRARIRGLFGLTPSQMPDSEVDAIYTVYRGVQRRGPGGSFRMQSKPWMRWGVAGSGSSATGRLRGSARSSRRSASWIASRSW